VHRSPSTATCCYRATRNRDQAFEIAYQRHVANAHDLVHQHRGMPDPPPSGRHASRRVSIPELTRLLPSSALGAPRPPPVQPAISPAEHRRGTARRGPASWP